MEGSKFIFSGEEQINNAFRETFDTKFKDLATSLNTKLNLEGLNVDALCLTTVNVIFVCRKAYTCLWSQEYIEEALYHEFAHIISKSNSHDEIWLKECQRLGGKGLVSFCLPNTDELKLANCISLCLKYHGFYKDMRILINKYVFS